MNGHDYTSDEATAARKEAAAAARAVASRRFHREQQKNWNEYLGTQQAARRYLLVAAANGATTFPKEIYERATAVCVVAATIGNEMNDQQFDQLMNVLNRISRDIRELITASEPDFRRTPEGLPICPKHGEPMTKREKQGDEWHSHKIIDPGSGEVKYCRGYHTKNGDGWHVQPAAKQPAAKQPADADGLAAELFEYVYADGTPVPDNPKTRQFFNQYRRAHGEKRPESGAVLAAWAKR